MFIAATTRCFAEKSFEEACRLITDLEYDKTEICFTGDDHHLSAKVVASDPERFFAHYRETTRLTPIALNIDHDVDVATLAGLSKASKLLRVTQITVPASPIGTPFNTEIDRLRGFLTVTSQDGIRLSLNTKSGHLTEDPHTAVELCQAVKGLGLTLDPSYYICGPNRDKPYDQVYPYVFHTHLRDTTPEAVQVKIGLGHLDYSKMIGSLIRENYNWALSVDILPSPENESDRPLEMRKLRMLLDSLL